MRHYAIKITTQGRTRGKFIFSARPENHRLGLGVLSMTTTAANARWFESVESAEQFLADLPGTIWGNVEIVEVA